jgi:hypothetical protein
MQFKKYNEQDITAEKKQNKDELVDITDWNVNDEILPYQEGKREKNIINCPEKPPFAFLIPKHAYLFKQSNKNFPWQCWMEIIAFRLGLLMQVPVPAVFISVDTNRTIIGALIEWFHNYPGEPREEYVHGGDLFLKLNPDYNRKKGTQHNLMELIQIINEQHDL